MEQPRDNGAETDEKAGDVQSIGYSGIACLGTAN